MVWGYGHLARQLFIMKLLHCSPFILDGGKGGLGVGVYIKVDNYLVFLSNIEEVDIKMKSLPNAFENIIKEVLLKIKQTYVFHDTCL